MKGDANNNALPEKHQQNTPPDIRRTKSDLTEAVPDSVAEEVVKAFPVYGKDAVNHVNAIREPYSILQRAFLVILAAAVVLAVCFFFPRTEPPPVKAGDAGPDDDTPDITSKSPLYELCSRALELYRSAKYTECAALLAPEMNTIAAKRKSDANDKLIYLYFDSVFRGNVSGEMRLQAKEYLSSMLTNAPDDIKWQLFNIGIFCSEASSYPLVYSALLDKNAKSYADHSIPNVVKCIDMVSRNIRKLELARGENDNRAKHLAMLELSKARMLVSLWMLKGGQGGVSFPDDNGDPGVDEREEAYRIAEKYPDDIESLRLRCFIIEKIRAQKTWYDMNSYYWKGMERFKTSDLQNEYVNLMGRIGKYELETRK